MLKTGFLNPAINALISRVRHTNTLVIADRGFPFWPEIETVDVSLVDDIPKVLDVLKTLRLNFVVGRVFMAEEFRRELVRPHGRNSSRRWLASPYCSSRMTISKNACRKRSD